MTVHRLHAFVLAVLVMAPSAVPASEPSAATLRRQFLQCEREAASALLGLADAARCSTVYEQLLRREFGGDFARLLVWWKGERQRQAAAIMPPR